MTELSVLFVCLGNICRSPLAEAAFRKITADNGQSIHIDSAGTSDYHVGDEPDFRAILVARKYGIEISHLRARQVEAQDFNRFSHIIAMDDANFRNLETLKPENATAQLSMLLDHVPDKIGQSVADPYHGGPAGFEATWAEVNEGARALAGLLLESQTA